MHRSTLVLIALLALALRAWPLHVFYLNPDHLMLPGAAVIALEEGRWRPSSFAYPSGEFDVLRGVYELAYWVGRATGAYRDRLDLVAAYFTDPFGFVLVPRIWSCLTGVATVVVTALLATEMFGPACGATAGVFLATSFGHVRESHWGSIDAPAIFFFIATLLATERYRQSARRADLVAAGVLAGCAAGFRYQLGLVALAPALAVALRRPPRRSDVAALATAGLSSVLAFLAWSPFALRDGAAFMQDVVQQVDIAYRSPQQSLGLGALLAAGNGVAVCALAALGVVRAVRCDPRASAPALAVALVLIALVGPANRLFFRYLLPLSPLCAVFAAVGVEAIATRVQTGRRIATIALVAAAVAEPAGRTLALDALLARTDTRIEAATWLAANAPRGALVLLPSFAAYANPELHPPPASDQSYVTGRLGRVKTRRRYDVRFAYAEYGLDGAALPAVWRPNAFAVTVEHPLPLLGRIPPKVAAMLSRDGDVVARFVGYEPANVAQMLFEPIDASAFPLRGMAAVERPGPNVTIYRLRERSTSPSTTGSSAPPRPLP
jgi:4-amino-4-deoxy-L-arabinose transferase-like glycosyltransferase